MSYKYRKYFGKSFSYQAMPGLRVMHEFLETYYMNNNAQDAQKGLNKIGSPYVCTF